MTRALAKITVQHLPKRSKIKKKVFVKRLTPISDQELAISWGLLEGKLNSQLRRPV
jgi:hypothetical protein